MMEATSYVRLHHQQQQQDDDEDPDVLAEDNTRPSLPEDFPNFRDFQIEKMVQYFRVVTDGSVQRLRLGFKCKLCGVVFNKTMQLLGHIRNHFEENHSCKDCGKYFFDTNKLNIHKRAKHTQALKCQLGCPSYTTSNIKCLQTHYLRYHCLKVRPKDMKKMEDTISTWYRHSENENKVHIQREIIADQQRSLPVPVQAAPSEQVPPEQVHEDEEEEEEEEDTEDQEDQENEVERDDQVDDDDEEDYDETEDLEQTVECCVCDVYIPSEEDLRVHEETHSSPYACKICFVAFDRIDDARNHYEAHEKTQVLQNPVQLQTVTLTPTTTIQHQPHQQTVIPIATSSGHQGPNMTTMLIMHNGTPILVPVQTLDSSQLVPAFMPQATQLQINPQPATTITPITSAWPINHLLPVNNHIEIIPIHSAQQTVTNPHAASVQGIPIHNIINLKPQQQQDPNNPLGHNIAAGGGGGGAGIVITPVTAIDQNYLRQHQQQQQQQQQQALQAQLHLQQQLQLRQQQQQQQQLQQQYQPQS